MGITKRKGNGQTECKRCKDNGKWSLTWDSFLYNFNDEPYCFNCLMELLEDYQERIDKAIKYIEHNSPNLSNSELYDLLEILKKGSDKDTTKK